MSSVDSNADNKVLTLSEVRELAEDKNKCIIIIDNNVYDLTRFLKEHRGGEEALKVQHGRDATKAFEDVGHSSDAREQMKAYKIAKLDSVKRTVTNEQCGGEVQIHALSIALRQPIYSCVKFLDDPKRVHSIPSDISTQDLINRFNDGTAGGHLKYIGYKSDMNKSSLCIHFTGIHYDALLLFSNNPHQFIPKNDIIDMNFVKKKKRTRFNF
ncbi:unnamed protein product [Rotaria socialis]|uniref:Cytochrome b5 n=1 Tax=Rotaria socialis TaxID=392032 RepID=A0A818FU96_9BILA|nr:unnamed protein product [Rotaria socialis]CAF4638760.1 unnamed protein product [Rotaria socialis]